MAASATVTGVTGAGQSVTAAPLTEISRVEFLFEDNVVRFTYGSNPSKTMEISLNGVTTVTDTISGGNHTIVVS